MIWDSLQVRLLQRSWWIEQDFHQQRIGQPNNEIG